MKSFEPFRLDTANHCLLRNEERIPISPKAFDVLRYLVENPGRLVTQNELLNAVWPDTYVNPENLRKYILHIRKILGDRSNKPAFVETVTKRGYRFIAPVLDDDVVAPSPGARFPPPCGVTPEAPTVSPEPEFFHVIKGFRSLPAMVALVAASAAIVGYLWFNRARAMPLSPGNTSIAVLPFVDMSPGKDQEYFSDGLTEALIDDLAKVPHLRVVARSSAFQFKGKNEDLRSVGHKLGVANVLEGSVRRDGDHMRITASLTKAVDGFQLWSESYDRDMSHIFSTQDEIARSVTDTLQLKLLNPGHPSSSTASRTTNADAYQVYLQAEYFSARGQDKQDLEAALSYADQAVRLDPAYAPAWAQRAHLLERLASIALIDSDGFRRARESAEKAIALDPGLAEGYLALGLVQTDNDWEWKGADASLRKAGQLEPGNGDILNARAYLAKAVGRLDDAVALSKQAIIVDPLRANSHLELGYDLYLVGRFDEAEPEFQRAQDLNPQLSSLRLARAEMLLAQRRGQDALAQMQYETGDWQRFLGEALAYFALGRSSDSDYALQQLIATHQNDCAFQIAEIYAFRGETDQAFRWMDRAVRQRDPGAPQFTTDPLMKNLPHDARYTELLKQTHLPME